MSKIGIAIGRGKAFSLSMATVVTILALAFIGFSSILKENNLQTNN
jgi:hypothetical protein